MKRFISALSVLAFASALSLVGCGDDDDGTGGGTAGKGNEPTAGAPGEGNNVACDPEQATTCQNDTDCPFVADGTARARAQTCGKGQCLMADSAECSRDCILESLEMTSDCANCYAAFVQCTKKECLGDCLTDPNSEGCSTCQVEQGCREDFNTCSGLPE
jgi:hypothetical protein